MCPLRREAQGKAARKTLFPLHNSNHDEQRQEQHRIRQFFSSLLDAVVTVARSAGDLDSRVAALSLLPRFQHTSASISKEMLGAILKALVDREGIVRIAAGDALAAIGGPSARLYLQRAIASEQDEAVRSRLQANIERLQGKR